MTIETHTPPMVENLVVPLVPVEDERGASLTEYALMIALIAVVCIGALGALSGSQEGSIGGSTSKLTSAMDNAGS